MKDRVAGGEGNPVLRSQGEETGGGVKDGVSVTKSYIWKDLGVTKGRTGVEGWQVV